MYKKLSELILEKEIIDSKIRGLRVRQVRFALIQMQAKVGCTAQATKAKHLVDEINLSLSKVHYLKSYVDGLLDQVEELLEEYMDSEYQNVLVSSAP